MRVVLGQMRLLALSALILCCVPSARAQPLSDYAGNYRVSKDEVIGIAEWELDPSTPRVLAFTNFRTGRIGVLGHLGTDRFALQAGLMSGAEVGQVVFHRRGSAIQSLTYASSDGRSQSAERVQTRSMSLSVRADGSRLDATLLLPPGHGPFPAVVLVPAGAVGRTASATFPNFFLSHGLAVLLYDRRPSAPTNTFSTYASDAVRAVEELRNRPDIDRTRVGLWGHSQGGFVSLIAASESQSIAFVIDHSGMSVPAWRQEIFRVQAEAEADGVSQNEIAAALEFERQLFDVARTGNGWERVNQRMRSDSAASWMSLVYRPASLAQLTRVWQNDFSFDPTPYAAKVGQPVLGLFGGLDRSTPIESAANLANAMKGRDNLTIEFFPTANHAFLDAVTGGNAELPTLSRFAPGMFETMSSWLRVSVGSRRSRGHTGEPSPTH